MTDYKAAAVIFTVDTAWKSKRTRDVRAKAVVESPIKESEGTKGGGRGSKAPMGVSQAISGYQDTNLTWGDIDFIRVSRVGLRYNWGSGMWWVGLGLTVEKHAVASDRQGYSKY